MFIEQIMIFALGFLVAGLLTLLFLPAFWRRANILSRRHLEMQMPLSMSEIVAERDQLRAEFAAEQRRLEQRLEAAEAARGADRRKLGERLIVSASLEEELANVRSEAGHTAQSLETAIRSINAAEAELSTTAKQLYDVDGALERRNALFADLKARHEALTQQSDEQRTTIAGLETRLSIHEADIEDLERTLGKLRIEMADARSAHDLVSTERDQFRADARTAQSRREALQLEFEAQARRIEELQGEIRSIEREKARLTADSADKLRQLEEAQTRVKERDAHISAHNDALAAIESKAALDADLARAGKAAVEGALEAQRREHDAARNEIARLREEIRQLSAETARLKSISPAAAAGLAVLGTGSDFPALRRAIAEMGAEIARVTSPSKAETEPRPEPRARTAEPARTTAAE